MFKKNNIYLSFIIINIFVSYSLASQDTLVLNQIGQSYISKLIGSRYFKIESENITLQEIKSLKDLKPSSFKKATIAEINKLKLRSNSSFKAKYILIVEYLHEFTVYESFKKDDFENASQIFNSTYINDFSDIEIKLITEEYNFIDISINFHVNSVNFNHDSTNRVFLKFYLNQFKYNLFEYEKGKFLKIGLNDDDFNGKIEKNIDYYFCDRSDSKYFMPDFINKTCNILSENNYIVIDSSHIYKVKLINNKTDKIIIEKVNEIKNKFDAKIISLFNQAPLNQTYDSLNAYHLKLNDLFNKTKYVYINFLIPRCITCLDHLAILDSLNKVYKNDLTILSLLDKDYDKENLPKIITKYNVQHPFGWSNKVLNNELLLDGYPYGVLFDKTGNLINIFNIDELTAFLQTNNSN